MKKEERELLVGSIVIVMLVATSVLITLFWGWALQVVMAWVGLTIPYYIAVLWIMLVRYIARLFKK